MAETELFNKVFSLSESSIGDSSYSNHILLFGLRTAGGQSGSQSSDGCAEVSATPCFSLPKCEMLDANHCNLNATIVFERLSEVLR